jgi:hypothetical protein
LRIKASSVDQVIEPSLVIVEVHIPPSSLLDGVQIKPLSQTGVVVYHSKTMGIVVIDTYTIPIFISNVTLAFDAQLVEIPVEVIFLHPVHNYALVAYDLAVLGLVGFVVVCAVVLHPESTCIE